MQRVKMGIQYMYQYVNHHLCKKKEEKKVRYLYYNLYVCKPFRNSSEPKCGQVV